MPQISSMRFQGKTAAELVGVADYLPIVSSYHLFVKEQGFPVESSTILQDNKLAMLLAKNRTRSCSKRARYVNAKYFHIN